MNRWHLSRLGLGTASLHHLLLGHKRLRVLVTAIDHGIRHIDTSPYYGDGIAELAIGQLAPRMRQSCTIATKFGLYPRHGSSRSAALLWLKRVALKAAGRDGSPLVDFSAEKANVSLEQSLMRMRVEQVELLLLHEPEIQLVPKNAILDWLQSAESKGKIKGWGIAGERSKVEPFLVERSPLARTIQTRDSIERREADFLGSYSRPLQLTYGYMRGTADPDATLRAALLRNHTGTVLISSTKPERIIRAAAIANAQP